MRLVPQEGLLVAVEEITLLVRDNIDSKITSFERP